MPMLEGERANCVLLVLKMTQAPLQEQHICLLGSSARTGAILGEEPATWNTPDEGQTSEDVASMVAERQLCPEPHAAIERADPKNPA